MTYDVTVSTISDAAFIDVRCKSVLMQQLMQEQRGEPRLFSALIPMTDEHCLIRTTLDRETLCHEWIESFVNDSGSTGVATINSDYYAGYSLTGPDCRSILSQACSVDLDLLNDASATRCRFARTAAIIQVKSKDIAYDIFAESSYQNYLSDWLLVATRQ